MSEPKEGADLIAVLKTAIRDSGLSLNQIAKNTGVNNAALSRFMRDERSLTLDTAAKLVEFFRIQVFPAAPLPTGETAVVSIPPVPSPTVRTVGKKK